MKDNLICVFLSLKMVFFRYFLFDLTCKHDVKGGKASASGSGGRGFESRPHHTKGVKNGTSGYLLGSQY